MGAGHGLEQLDNQSVLKACDVVNMTIEVRDSTQARE